MHNAIEPTRDPRWVLTHEGYNVVTENAENPASHSATGSWECGHRARSAEARPG